MKRFITYCRQRIAPRLSMDATQALQDFYVQVRDTVRQDEKARAIPITVRQLEALVRISESLAKMHLKIQVTSENVQEAIRLFKVSTMNASQDGGTRGLFGAFHEKAAVVEEAILKMVHVGVRMDTTALYIKLESQLNSNSQHLTEDDTLDVLYEEPGAYAGSTRKSFGCIDDITLLIAVNDAKPWTASSGSLMKTWTDIASDLKANRRFKVAKHG
ncbi:hypothetical protein DYB36_013447 [Aphanomyces astaci]|uniref:DNA replication licensing factor MCM5 n=1 Tax=Aphanomyces astaci TaxID=112090 RepID=A0A397A115_APHAT|nr:hypothetical protein DYB36_013447 [Aphanomyces astaci]